jgi:hypothetical protein
MRKHFRAAVAALALVAAAPIAAPAYAQSEADKAQARDLGEAGFKALDAQDWAKAEDLFRRAEQLYHAPTLCVGLARAQAHLHKYVESWENYHRVIVDGLPTSANAAMVQALANANAEIGAVASKRALVTITVTGPSSPTVTVDDHPINAAGLGVERPVDPGTHVVKATAQGYDDGQTSFTVGEGASTKAEIDMKASAATPPAAGQTPGTTTTIATPGADTPAGGAHGGSTQRTLGWVALGVGAVGIVTGAVAGILVISQHGDLSNACGGGTCGPSQQSDLDSYHTKATISTVGFIIGGVAAAGGAVLLLTAPKRETGAAAAYVTPYVGLGSVGAVGVF